MARWKPRTDIERLLEKVSFGFGEDACWTWIGGRQKDDYGTMGIILNGKWCSVLVHRKTWVHV
jgi:hypothetical protein